MSDLPAIVYEDDSMIAFDKPSGLLIAPDRWDKNLENLAQMIHAKLSPKYFNAHRLDRDTSGLVLFAKTKPVLDRLCGLFQSHRIVKRYVALTRRAPEKESGVVTLRMAEDARQPGKMRTAKFGKPAETEYEVGERFRSCTVVNCRPRTGRTHQLRVHLAALKCPIIGDVLYGDGVGLFLSTIKKDYKKKDREPERPLVGRLALHAQSLAFDHPVTGQPVTILAPLPKDFELALKYLRKFE